MKALMLLEVFGLLNALQNISLWTNRQSYKRSYVASKNAIFPSTNIYSRNYHVFRIRNIWRNIVNQSVKKGIEQPKVCHI